MNHAFSSLLGAAFVLACASAGCASNPPPPASPPPSPAASSEGVTNNQPPPTDGFVFVEKDQKHGAADDSAPATDLHPTDSAARPKIH